MQINTFLLLWPLFSPTLLYISHPFPFLPSTHNLARPSSFRLSSPFHPYLALTTLKFAHRPSFSSSRENHNSSSLSILSFFTFSNHFRIISRILMCECFHPLIYLSWLICSHRDENSKIIKKKQIYEMNRKIIFLLLHWLISSLTSNFRNK